MDIGKFNLGTSGDDLYRALLETFDGMSDEEQLAAQARLLLMMMNYIGDPSVLHKMFERARAKPMA